MQIAETHTALRRQRWLADRSAAVGNCCVGEDDFVHVAFHALNTYRHVCSAQNSDNGWVSAEYLLLGMTCRSAYRTYDRDWSMGVSTHIGEGSEAIALPVTSGLSNTPVFAAYGICEPRPGEHRCDAPIVAVDASTSRTDLPASRDAMIRVLEFLIKAALEPGCAQKLDAALSALKSRRLFAGFAPPAIHSDACVQSVNHIVYKSERYYCRNTLRDLNIFFPNLNRSGRLICYALETMPRKLEIKIIDPVKAGEATLRPVGSLQSTGDTRPRSLRAALGLSGLTPSSQPLADDDDTESPFSAENMRLVFLGKRKPKPYDLG